MTGPFVIVPLSPLHDRAAFSCGNEVLDKYLQTQATQDIRRHLSNCFVAIAEDGGTIAGYYTLAASSVPVGDIPPELSRRLPRYPVLPAVLVGRLAVDRRFARRSLGAALLYDAIARALKADPAVFALIVDAKDENAAKFYEHFGFQPLGSRKLSYFLPMGTASKLTSR